jgi:hypothetical protein
VQIIFKNPIFSKLISRSSGFRVGNWLKFSSKRNAVLGSNYDFEYNSISCRTLRTFKIYSSYFFAEHYGCSKTHGICLIWVKQHIDNFSFDIFFQMGHPKTRIFNLCKSTHTNFVINLGGQIISMPTLHSGRDLSLGCKHNIYHLYKKIQLMSV